MVWGLCRGRVTATALANKNALPPICDEDAVPLVERSLSIQSRPPCRCGASRPDRRVSQLDAIPHWCAALLPSKQSERILQCLTKSCACSLVMQNKASEAKVGLKKHIFLLGFGKNVGSPLSVSYKSNSGRDCPRTELSAAV